jgi:DNA-binding PadR family transcriptional regulator
MLLEGSVRASPLKMLTETRYAMLGLLVREPGCGYDLARRFREEFGSNWQLNRGQVYSMLRTLERYGMVEGSDETRGGRDVRNYRINDAGRRAFQEWRSQHCTEAPPYREELYLKMRLCDPSELPELLLALEMRRRSCIERLSAYNTGDPAADDETCDWDSLSRELMDERTAVHYHTELDWLRRMQKRIENHIKRLRRTGALDYGRGQARAAGDSRGLGQSRRSA